MQQHVRANGLSEKSRVGLVCGRTAKDIFLTTDLLQFYLRMGIVVDRIRTFYEYIPTTETGVFSDLVIHYRKQGDEDPSLKSIAEAWKLTGE